MWESSVFNCLGFIHVGNRAAFFLILICQVYCWAFKSLPRAMRGKTHLTTGTCSNPFSFFFLLLGCKIQAGSSARGRCSHWRSGGGSYWSPCRLQSGRNCSCTWWWDFGFHRWKTDTKKKTETDRAGLLQLSRAFLPKCQKIQLKYRLVTTRNRSTVAVLMTDLQPPALDLRLRGVNSAAVQLRGKGETVTSELWGFVFSDVISDFSLLTLRTMG